MHRQPMTAAGGRGKSQTRVLVVPAQEHAASVPRFVHTSRDFPVHYSQKVHQNLPQTIAHSRCLKTLTHQDQPVNSNK